MKKMDAVNDNITRLVMKYMIPSVIGMIGLSLCIFLDTMFIGRGVGNDGLAALNISIPIYNLFNATGLIFGVGGATVLAINIGKKRFEVLNEIFTTAIIIAFIVGIVFSILGGFYLEKIAILLGASNELFILVTDYLRVILLASFTYILASSLNVFVRNDNAPKIAMWAIIGTNITNIILDYILIFPLDMGMQGAAIATTIGQIVGIGILLTHFLSKESNIKFKLSAFSLKYLRKILINGFPSFILEVSAGIVIFIFNVKLLKIGGDVAVSAYSIIANVALIFVAIFTGVSQGIQPLLGVNYGANKIDRVKLLYKIGVRISLILGIIFFMIGILEPEILISIFSSNTGELMEVAKNGIMIYFIAFIPTGVNIVNIGFLQSIEKSKLSTLLSLIRGLILIPIIINIFSQIFGVNGVWMTTPIAEVLTLIISGILVKRVEKSLL